MTIEERLRYYLADFYKKKIFVSKEEQSYFREIGPNKIVLCEDPVLVNCPTKNWWGGDNGPYDYTLKCFSAAYNDVGFILKNFYKKKKHPIVHLPILSAARKIGDNIILAKYDYKRCWKPLENINNNFIQWDQKINEPVWRGVLSGSYGGIVKQPNRKQLVETYQHIYNIGTYHSNKNTPHIIYDKNSLTIREQQSYKYIVVMEGNDIASCMPWCLNSGSVILMPPPQTEKWVLEGLLKPWVHYVPLDESKLDLCEKVEWCKKNDSKCFNIVKNAIKHASMFLDEVNELKIHNALIAHYKEYVFFE